jgi:hypothetical protein
MKYLLFALTLFVSACSVKHYEITSTKLFTIKTSQMRFNDIAYLRHSGDAVELELYMAGQVVNKITINHLICVQNKGCMTKSQFNSRFLVEEYPSDILQHILLKKPIFEGQNLQKTKDGFEQTIQTNSVNIIYKVDAKRCYFKDKHNHILIKMKDMNNGK